MKRLFTLFLSLFLLLGTVIIPSQAAGETFQCAVQCINASGKEITDLTSLKVGDTVTITTTLTRNDIASGREYQCWGLEIDIRTMGMRPVENSAKQFNGATISDYAIGAATGIGNLRFYKINQNKTPFSVAREVSVTAKYTVEDPEHAQGWSPKPLIYLYENDAPAVNVVSVHEIGMSSYVNISAEPGKLTSEDPSGVMEDGTTFLLPSAAREGYLHRGWLDRGEIYGVNDEYTVDGNANLTARWGGTLKLNAGDNASISGTDPSGDHDTGASVTLPAAVRNEEGWYFRGWERASDGTFYLPGEKYVVDGNETLNALWNDSSSTEHEHEYQYRYVHQEGKDKHNVTRVCKNGGETDHYEEACILKYQHMDANSHSIYCADCGYVYGTEAHIWSGNICIRCGFNRSAGRKDDNEGSSSSSNNSGGNSSDGNNSGGNNSGGNNSGGTTTPVTTPVVNPSNGVQTLSVDILEDDNEGLTAQVVQNEDGTIAVSVKDRDGKEVTGEPHPLLVKIPEAHSGDVVVIIEPTTGEIIEIVKQSLVEGSMAWALLDEPATIKIIRNAKPFPDVSDTDWFKNAVDFVSSHELYLGLDDGTFAPNSPMTRGMLVTVLWRLENYPDSFQNETVFPDVENDAWYTQAVAWATEKGIVKGYDDGNFYPDQHMTRQEMATMLRRYMNYLSYDTSKSNDLSTYPDKEEVATWALEHIQWTVGAEIITGKDDGRLDPLGTTTRAEVATMLMRIVTRMVK